MRPQTLIGERWGHTGLALSECIINLISSRTRIPILPLFEPISSIFRPVDNIPTSLIAYLLRTLNIVTPRTFLFLVDRFLDENGMHHLGIVWIRKQYSNKFTTSTNWISLPSLVLRLKSWHLLSLSLYSLRINLFFWCLMMLGCVLAGFGLLS